MQPIRALVAVVALAVAGACAPAPVDPGPTTGTAEDEAAIDAMMQNVAVAWNSKDAAAMTAMVTDDYNGVGPDGVHIQGRASYEARLAEDFAEERPEGMMLSIQRVYIHWHSYDLATAGGTFEVAGLPEGVPNSGSWMVNFVRTDGGWRTSNGLVAQFMPEPPASESGGE